MRRNAARGRTLKVGRTTWGILDRRDIGRPAGFADERFRPAERLVGQRRLCRAESHLCPLHNRPNERSAGLTEAIVSVIVRIPNVR
jgi:hypothetical protein